MKYLGLDYGSKRVGVAISNNEGTIAFPRTTFENDRQLLQKLQRLIAEEKVEHIVIGDTLSHGGSENPVTREAGIFMGSLREGTNVPVSTAFEAWSSIEASRYTASTHDDSAAAAIILQRFLDMRAGR